MTRLSKTEKGGVGVGGTRGFTKTSWPNTLFFFLFITQFITPPEVSTLVATSRAQYMRGGFLWKEVAGTYVHSLSQVSFKKRGIV